MTTLVTSRTRGIGHAGVEEVVGLDASVYTCTFDEAESGRPMGQVAGSVCDVSSRAEREKLMEDVSNFFNAKLNIHEWPSPSSISLLATALLLALVPPSAGYKVDRDLTLIILNNCPYHTWPAIQPSSGYSILEKGDFFLPSRTHCSFLASYTPWSGRIWAAPAARTITAETSSLAPP
ncbi:hypothetical protein SAY87_028691 [Trapa incisa]|uniref:Uncharacterized protein n=1 Tax=Trapa incisa TaxID=236973 RepID=A0AAN7QPK9_9MYRT|nr:hypothetical protein SAY87_028691 [Trapa incisa]